MTKLVGPLFSLAASGKFGDTLTYVCGLYARRAVISEKMEFSQAQTDHQSKWSLGCKVWNTLGNNKELWVDFAEWVKKNGTCDVSLAYYMTGFQTFMSYYMGLGEEGWQNYPNPPFS